MTPFEDWLYSIENFSTRYERCLIEIYYSNSHVKKWLKAAYDEGFMAGKQERDYEI